jgi:hypothetical protein
MREGDADAIDHLVREAGREAIHVADRSRDFFTRLAGETNPERKRTIIGETFLVVQEEEFARLGLRDDEWLLGQGTIYPDTIESGGASHSAKIKTHHNRVERIQALIAQGKVIEPLVELYKDEVRVLGEQLGLPHEVVWRHPFPGPGLAVRCLGGEHTGAVEPFTLALPPGVRAALVPVRTVGVQGDERSYSNLLALDGTLEADGRRRSRPPHHQRAPHDQPGGTGGLPAGRPGRGRAWRFTRRRSHRRGSRSCARPTTWSPASCASMGCTTPSGSSRWVSSRWGPPPAARPSCCAR